MELPKDPMMLFSFINMKLRDFYPSLDALCQDMQVILNNHQNFCFYSFKQYHML